VEFFFWMFRDYFAAQRLTRFAQEEKTKLNLKKKNSRFLVTGGSGFIGQALCQALLREGHDVTVVCRNKVSTLDKFSGISGKITLVDSLDTLAKFTKNNFDVIVNLQGEPLAGGRWTNTRKENLFNSRVDFTKQLVNFMSTLQEKNLCLYLDQQ